MRKRINKLFKKSVDYEGKDKGQGTVTWKKGATSLKTDANIKLGLKVEEKFFYAMHHHTGSQEEG